MKRVTVARKNCKGVRSRCVSSCHVACNIVGSDPVDDGRVGNPTRFSRLITHSFSSRSFRQAAAMLQSPSFVVDLFFIASSDAQMTKCVDASCGFGTAVVSETGLLDLSTSSSWCSCSVRLFPPCCLQWRAEWAIRPQWQNRTHSGRASCKLFELFTTRFFTMARSAKQRLCHKSANKHVCTYVWLARALRNRARFQP